jgi:putative endopeptidase
MRSVFLLSACSKQIEQQQTNMADETPSEDMIKKSAELGSFGIKLDARDESVKPVMTFLNMLAALGIKTG